MLQSQLTIITQDCYYSTTKTLQLKACRSLLTSQDVLVFLSVKRSGIYGCVIAAEKDEELLFVIEKTSRPSQGGLSTTPLFSITRKTYFTKHLIFPAYFACIKSLCCFNRWRSNKSHPEEFPISAIVPAQYKPRFFHFENYCHKIL